jgi:hypothetical protein
MMAGPTAGDLVVALGPLVLLGALYVIGLLIGLRQAKALERIAATLEKRP